MGKAHRGRRLGKGETAIQREALPDFLPPGHQANPAREDRGDAEFECGPSLFDQTPSHEDFRGSSQGAGDQTWVACRDKIREVCDELVRTSTRHTVTTNFLGAFLRQASSTRCLSSLTEILLSSTRMPMRFLPLCQTSS